MTDRDTAIGKIVQHHTVNLHHCLEALDRNQQMAAEIVVEAKADVRSLCLLEDELKGDFLANYANVFAGTFKVAREPHLSGLATPPDIEIRYGLVNFHMKAVKAGEYANMMGHHDVIVLFRKREAEKVEDKDDA